MVPPPPAAKFGAGVPNAVGCWGANGAGVWLFAVVPKLAPTAEGVWFCAPPNDPFALFVPNDGAGVPANGPALFVFAPNDGVEFAANDPVVAAFVPNEGTVFGLVPKEDAAGV